LPAILRSFVVPKFRRGSPRIVADDRTELSMDTILGEIELKRRSVQSYVEINFFLLDESGSTSAVNNTFLSFGIRDKKPQE
jgi:hypothetical protein